MKQEEFAKLLADAIEVAAAHPVKIGKDSLYHSTVLHVLDRDEVLWRIEIREPK